MMKRVLKLSNLLGILFLSALIPVAIGQATTPNLGLYKPVAGQLNWANQINGNFDTLDSWSATIQSKNLLGSTATPVALCSATQNKGGVFIGTDLSWWICTNMTGSWTWSRPIVSASLIVNGSAVPAANLNSTTPSANPAYVNAVVQVSGAYVSVEVPAFNGQPITPSKVTSPDIESTAVSCLSPNIYLEYDGTCGPGSVGGGVNQLNGETGNVSITGDNIAVTPSGSTIALHGTGALPANANFVYTGTSINADDAHVLSPAVAITGWTTAAGVTTVTNSGTNNFSSGQWVYLYYATGWAACPTGEIIATGCNLFQVQTAGLSTSQFKLNTSTITAGTCSSSCGSAYSAMSYLPFATSSSNGFPPAALNNTHVFLANPVTIGGIAAKYTTYLHPLSPVVTGNPGYLIIDNNNNDAGLCIAAATTEAAYQSVFTAAHADGYVVVVGTPTGTYWSQFSLSCSTAYNIQYQVDQWLRMQGKASVLSGSPTSTAYWDIASDIHFSLWDGSNTNNIIGSNNGLEPAGVDIASRLLATDILSGTGKLQPSNPVWYGYGVGSGLQTVDGVMFVPFSDTNWQWWNAARTTREAYLESSTGNFYTNGQLGVYMLNGPNCGGGSAAFCVGEYGSNATGFTIDAFGDASSSGDLTGGTVKSNAGSCAAGSPYLEYNGTCGAGGTSDFVQIAHTVLGSAAASITFSAIPGTYSNLRLIVNGQSANSAQDDLHAQFNADTGSNYDYGGAYGGGGGAGTLSGNGAAFLLIGSFNVSSATGYSSSSSCDLQSYSATTFYKTLTCNAIVYNASNPQGWQVGGGWRNTAAITSIKFSLASGSNFTTGTTATLYGMK